MGGSFNGEGHLSQNADLTGASIKYEAFISDRAFIRSNTINLSDHI